MGVSMYGISEMSTLQPKAGPLGDGDPEGDNPLQECP